jgi:hypothetical protein
MDELSSGLRDVALRFLMAASRIDLDAEGLPCNPDQALEVDSTSRLARRLTDALRPTDGPAARAMWVMAEEWNCLLAAHEHGTRRLDVGRRWLAARANAADLLGFAPGGPSVPDDLSQIQARGPRFVEWAAGRVDGSPRCDSCGEPVIPGQPHPGC